MRNKAAILTIGDVDADAEGRLQLGGGWFFWGGPKKFLQHTKAGQTFVAGWSLEELQALAQHNTHAAEERMRVAAEHSFVIG